MGNRQATRHSQKTNRSRTIFERLQTLNAEGFDTALYACPLCGSMIVADRQKGLKKCVDCGIVKPLDENDWEFEEERSITLALQDDEYLQKAISDILGPRKGDHRAVATVDKEDENDENSQIEGH